MEVHRVVSTGTLETFRKPTIDGECDLGKRRGWAWVAAGAGIFIRRLLVFTSARGRVPVRNKQPQRSTRANRPRGRKRFNSPYRAEITHARFNPYRVSRSIYSPCSFRPPTRFLRLFPPSGTRVSTELLT